jgi:hypothetical protein
MQEQVLPTQKQVATFERLVKELKADGCQKHPSEILLDLDGAEKEGLTFLQCKRLMQLWKEEQEKRVPANVLAKSACMICWGLGARIPCHHCQMWNLCTSCDEAFEGNCLQCLYEDQEKKAKEAVRKRSGLSPS